MFTKPDLDIYQQELQNVGYSGGNESDSQLLFTKKFGVKLSKIWSKHCFRKRKKLNEHYSKTIRLFAPIKIYI